VFAFLDDDVPGAARHDPSRRSHEVVFVRELPRFGVVERDEVDMLEQLEHVVATAFDPEVHRVASDELGFGHLRQHVELQSRIDVAQEHERRVAELCRDLRTKIREHTEMRLECLGHVQIVAVPAAPPERRALGALQSREVDRSRRKRALQFVDRVVAPDHADELHRR
jgi:hypothetical protein